MPHTVNVSKTSKLPQVTATLAKLAKARVLVGIPQAKASRKGTPINNAELMYIHTEGSPIRNIPARPVLQPAIENKQNKANIVEQMEKAGQAAFAGDPQGLENGLALAGTVASNAAKKWFTNPENGWAPNAPLTIKLKGSDKPLIDTGQLRRAIVSVVDPNGTA